MLISNFRPEIEILLYQRLRDKWLKLPENVSRSLKYPTISAKKFNKITQNVAKIT